MVQDLPKLRSRLKVRAFDLVVASLALVVLAPAIAIIAALVKLTSKGPVLYSQERLGRNRQPFMCLKFRTMFDGADGALAALLAVRPELADEHWLNYKLRHDPRVTRLGRFLRSTSLDELPQLVNVLRGEMSIVGPRPIVEQEAVRYGHQLAEVLTVKPGMTGLWQVSGRSTLTYQERVGLDVWYVRRPRRLRRDAAICIRTLSLLSTRDGAY